MQSRALNEFFLIAFVAFITFIVTNFVIAEVNKK